MRNTGACFTASAASSPVGAPEAYLSSCAQPVRLASRSTTRRLWFSTIAWISTDFSSASSCEPWVASPSPAMRAEARRLARALTPGSSGARLRMGTACAASRLVIVGASEVGGNVSVPVCVAQAETSATAAEAIRKLRRESGAGRCVMNFLPSRMGARPDYRAPPRHQGQSPEAGATGAALRLTSRASPVAASAARARIG